MELEIGETYHRRDELASHGGIWGSGIITSKDSSYVFIVTGDQGEEFGYNDEFLDDGTFLYTGQGGEGDMEWRATNRAIRDHQSMEKDLHVFEKTDESYMVAYAGEYQYEDHFWQELPDKNGDLRQAIRFRLVPIGGKEIAVDGDVNEMSLSELYEQASRAAPQRSKPNTGTGSAASNSGEKNELRADVVKKFALQSADGVCKGCGEDAPFIGKDGMPFLEVHHIDRLGDGGADHPNNVIAICPNCHRRVHQGHDGRQFNKELRQKADNRNQGF